ncbi:hypothetical protein EON80_14115, partial [bacterium]
MKRPPVVPLLAASLFLFSSAFAAPDAILTRVSGTVTVWRGASRLPGKSGLKLQKGDKVVVAKGSATVFTLSAPPRTLTSGQLMVSAAAAPKAGSSSVWKNVYTGLNQGLGASNRTAAAAMRVKPILTVNSPVKTLVETDCPRFEWAPFFMVGRYQVVISNEAGEVLRAQTADAFLEYPAGAPKLTGAYKWQLTALRKQGEAWVPSTSITPSPWSSFQIATPAQLAAVRADLAQLDAALKTALPSERFLARAGLWRAAGFTMAALRELEKIAT